VSRRWIASARSTSISCSVIAHASAWKGSAMRAGRSHGLRRMIGPSRRSFLNWAWNYFSWDRGNRIIIPYPD